MIDPANPTYFNYGDPKIDYTGGHLFVMITIIAVILICVQTCRSCNKNSVREPKYIVRDKQFHGIEYTPVWDPKNSYYLTFGKGTMDSLMYNAIEVGDTLISPKVKITIGTPLMPVFDTHTKAVINIIDIKKGPRYQTIDSLKHQIAQRDSIIRTMKQKVK